MATVISQPYTFSFSSMLADVVFGSSAESGVLVLDLVCKGERMNLLRETLYPVGGKVEVSDLSPLVEPYARQFLEVTMECSFADGGVASIAPVTVFFSMADVGERPADAEDFVNNHFLTTLNGEKLTALGRTELLYARGVSSVLVTADIRLASGVFTTMGGTIAAVATEVVSRFEVSPSAVAIAVGLPAGGTLLGYTVSAGSREQRFVVVADAVVPAPSLLFVNSFGCEELIHCVGTHKKDSKYTRSSARIGSKLRNYRIVEDRQFTASTGWLNTAMADWADELFRSEQVRLWVDGSPGKDVVIRDSKSEISNEDDHLPSFEFTYGYAQRIHNVLQPSHAGRIFDNTFDYTFN